MRARDCRQHQMTILQNSLFSPRCAIEVSEVRRNSAILLPSDRLSCGSLRGPKKTSAITRMKRSSVSTPSDSRIKKTTGFKSTFSSQQLEKPLERIVTCTRINQKLGGKVVPMQFALAKPITELERGSAGCLGYSTVTTKPLTLCLQYPRYRAPVL